MLNRPSESPFNLGHAIFIKKNTLAWFVLAVALLTTLLAWQYLHTREQASAQRQFEILTSDIASSIRKRMVNHEQILLGATGLIDASEVVTRQEWKRQIERLRLAEHYPGIMGVGFAAVIAPENLAAFEADVQAEGFPGFRVHPEGERALYTSILFLEPFSGRNLAAFGFDMYSEPTRRQAMQAAASSGQTRVTGAVKLLQETHGEVQAGILMYVPVYTSERSLATDSLRNSALKGFVYSPYRMGDLLDGILGEESVRIDYRLTDITTADESQLLFQSYDDENASEPLFTRELVLDLYGRKWQIDFNSTAEFDSSLPGHALMLAAGTCISLMVFLLASLLTLRRDQAEALASRMTQKLRASNEALQQSEERQRLVLKGSNDGWWDVNVEEWRFIASARSLEMLGYPQQRGFQALHRWQSVIAPTARHALLTELKEIIESDAASFALEARFTHKNGEEVPLLLRGAIQRDAQGKAVRASGTMLDLTEQKRVEAMKSEFVSTVSHELRTPLTSISGALGIVNSGSLGPVPDKIQKMLEIAHANSLRLNHLINDLLDMEKLAAGKMSLDMRVQRIDTLVDEAITANQAYAEVHGVELNHSDAEPYWGNVDGNRLQQVISNFLSNAIKFSPPSGQVTVQMQIRKDQLRVSVTDQGSGIPEAFQARIFGKFAQADGADNRQKPGTGLGLAICRELMLQMDGAVGFDSPPGQGATFWFELPLAADPSTDDSIAASDLNVSVLVLEDDETAAQFMDLLLRRGGYEPVIANNLRQAKQLLEESTPCALVTDLRLPDGHGLSLIRELRQRKETHHLPVLVVSAYCDEGQRLLDSNVKGIAWLDKPVDESKVVPLLMGLIKRMQMSSSRS